MVDVTVGGTSAQPVVIARGEVDLVAAGALTRAAAEARRGDRVVFDVSGVTFMESVGLSVFVRLHTEGVAVVLRQPSRYLRELLQITQLEQLVEIEDPAPTWPGAGPMLVPPSDADRA